MLSPPVYGMVKELKESLYLRMRLYCRRRRRVLETIVETPFTLTYQQVLAVCQEQGLEEEFQEFVIEDVLRIVNDGVRYPRKRHPNRIVFPEDFSIAIAGLFGVKGRLE